MYVVGIESEYFVVYLSCVYIYVRLNIYYVELRTCYFVSPLQCLVYHIFLQPKNSILLNISMKPSRILKENKNLTHGLH